MQRGMHIGMKRCWEPVDLMVIVGLCATVFGAYFLYMSSSGMLQAGMMTGPTVNESPTIMDAMDWVQPALGEAIVEDTLLEQQFSVRMSGVALRLSQAILTAIRLEPSSLFEEIRQQAQRMESSHSARMEYVLGRSIVESTSRGVRTGALSTEQLNSVFNTRLLLTAVSIRGQMETAFRDLQQPTLGQAIVQRSLDQIRLGETVQRRIGETVRDLTIVQEQFQRSEEALQGQLAATIIAAVKTELRAELFDRLAAAEFPEAASRPLTMPAALPSVPVGLLLGATAVLISILVLGLTGMEPSPELLPIEANGERWNSVGDIQPTATLEATVEQPAVYRRSA